jgi:hypothetical protein
MAYGFNITLRILKMIKCSMAIVASFLCLAISGCQSAQTAPSPVAITCERHSDLGHPKIVFDATEHDCSGPL